MSTYYKTAKPEGGILCYHYNGGVDWCFYPGKSKKVLIESLKYCQKEKGLEVYAYCIMTNHNHMIWKGAGEIGLAQIIRDFKKFTSKRILNIIEEEPESSRKWMHNYFEDVCKHLKREQKYKVWKDGYHAEILYSRKFLLQKLHYIHNNPVKARIVDNPEHYLFSSARNYAGLDEELEIVLIDLF